ncbi:MAG: helix-turn-helix transcriptional regulator [Clostridiales bacterium]|nr:helix-turn-helix transcriptional regulator [Clostridiales bacterium]
MIRFDKLWQLMAQRGLSTYWLREKCGIDNKTVRRLCANENMETKTLSKLCAALLCDLVRPSFFSGVSPGVITSFTLTLPGFTGQMNCRRFTLLKAPFPISI